MTLYSYVVEHDNGHAPNPYFGVCTLCRCKYRDCSTGRRNIVERAEVGDWVVGTGGASTRSAGHGKIVYAMRVDEKPTRGEYFTDPRFVRKKPVKMRGYKQTRGDNERPRNLFEKCEQFALVSWHFYYFGANAVDIPREFKLEKKGPGFRRDFDPAEIQRFVEWLESQYKPGKHGEPCQKVVDRPKGIKKCKSSC